jgi:hypothetical protein
MLLGSRLDHHGEGFPMDLQQGLLLFGLDTKDNDC